MSYQILHIEEIKTESTSVLIEAPREQVLSWGAFYGFLEDINRDPVEKLASNKPWYNYYLIRDAGAAFYDRFTYTLISWLAQLWWQVRGARGFVEVVPWDQVPEWLPDADGKTWAEYGNLAQRWEQWYYSLHDRLSGHTVGWHSQDIFTYPLKATHIAILLSNWYTILNPEEFNLLSTDE